VLASKYSEEYGPQATSLVSAALAADFFIATFYCLHSSILSMSQSPFEIELDEMTLTRARRGDISACEQIYRKFHQPAYSLAYRICKCRELSRDVTQDAFITALGKIRQFRGDAPFWGWLRRVVVNHSISALRKLPKADLVELQEFHSHTDGHHDRVILSMDLESALFTLGTKDRAVVWLHDVEGYNHREIAGLFGMTESFSKTRLSRARTKLRDILERRITQTDYSGMESATF
jgi:RNA polymerase sigma-70 factor (ECF subfamily)